ncbi:MULTISPECIES: TRAP transporter substrate-binding protein [Natrialbaceae]|uniref:TRAP transporter substrate-binding protein n=1 Tax=Natrialbaceae TaxID=1644061 RepID=UPI00207D0312|nr:TRAP transporter substrate-binding protein [Natronococcus sp. CG52]
MTVGNNLNRRKFLSTAGAASVSGMAALAGCMGGDNGGVEMTIGSAFEPGHINVEAAEMFAEEIEEQSDGDFEVEVTPGGAMGAEDEITSLVAEQGAEAHAAGTVPFDMYTPEYWFFGSPFVMEDYDHLLRVMDTDIMEGVEDQMIEEGNQRPLGQQIYRGERHFTANSPVTAPEDLEGLALRLPELDPWVDIWDQVGADPTPVALDELYSALEQGTADSSEGDAEQISSFNLHEVQSHVSLTGHLVETGNIYMNEDFFQSLDDSYQDMVLEIGSDVTEEAAEISLEREDDLIDELEEEGMEVVDDVDHGAFEDEAEDAVEQWFDEEWVGTWDDVLSI